MYHTNGGDKMRKVTVIQPNDTANSLVKPSKHRIAAYVRVSTNLKKQEDSLENQRTHYEKLIKENPEWELVGIFVDQGISGYKKKRPEFLEMLKLAMQQKIDLIIVKSISRFARNTTIVLETVRELKILGIGVYFEEENINTLSGDGELMLSILASFAQEELRSMSENYKWVFQKKFERGEVVLNTTRFLGYDKGSNGELVINPEEAKIIRFIFETYLSGTGSYTIAKKMNELQVPTITGGKWYPGVIRNILKNEKYKGDVKLHKYFTKDSKKNHTNLNRGESYSYYITEHHEAIISKKEWDKVQEMMLVQCKKKNIDRVNTKKYENKYPCTGILFCGKCGAVLRRQYVYNKKVQWQCGTYLDEGKSICEGVKIYDTELQKQQIDGPTIIREEIFDGKKNYIYTTKAIFE